MKKYIIISNILLMVLFASCEKFLDVNTDPNNPTEVTANLILPVAQVYSANYNHDSSRPGVRSSNHLGNLMMHNWGQTFGFNWYNEEFQYLVTPTFYDDLFDDAYTKVLKQYTVLENYDDNHGYYKAIAKIMKSYHFQILVDLYGDVPYSDALQRGGNPTPKYDDAQTIYTDLIVQLTNAIAMIDEAAANPKSVEPAEDDIMFGGDMVLWKSFANTVKIRILTRQSDVASSSYVTGELAVIANEGSGYITGDIAINPGYAVQTDQQNPYWESIGWNVGGSVAMSNDATCATQSILDYLTTSNDPRINYIYEEPATGHLGVEQGQIVLDNYAADFVSNVGPGHLKSATMDAVIFTFAEHNFNLSELAFKGFGGNAEDLYNAGVQASFTYLGAGAATSYLSQVVPNVNYAASTNKLEAIITQKWIALNGIDAIQSWFDYSRTGYPANLPVSLLASTPDRPVRLYYPSSEVTGNTTNIPAQADAFTKKIFWAN